MNDKKLLRTIMFRKEWNQTQLGVNIGVSAQQVSHVVNERSNLGKAARMLAEHLLKETLPPNHLEENNSVETPTA